MKVVIVDKPDVTLEVKRSQLYVDGQGIPLRLIEVLVLQDDVVLHTKLILKLSQEGISIMHISSNHKDIALTLPLVAKNSEVKMLQYASLDARLGMAKYFVDEKIHRHIMHLKSIGIAVDETAWREKVNQAQSIEVLLGVEGSFTRLYFGYYFELFAPALHHGKRSRHPALDPVNAILSYLYTIVYNLLTVKLYIAGFEPAISYLHTPYRSHYALSSDMMELFRAKVNALVLEWFDEGTLKAEDFSYKNGVWLRYESRKKLWQEIKTLLGTVSAEADREISLLRTAIS